MPKEIHTLATNTDLVIDSIFVPNYIDGKAVKIEGSETICRGHNSVRNIYIYAPHYDDNGVQRWNRLYLQRDDIEIILDKIKSIELPEIQGNDYTDLPF